MKTRDKSLTIVTIGYKNNLDLIKTYNSFKNILNETTVSIVQDGGMTFTKKECPKSKIYQESDEGIFDAINKAIAKINTSYFMLVHSGDELLYTKKQIDLILDEMHSNNLDLMLGSQYINTGSYNRFHSVKSWHPIMLNFGVQPPHLPTIYKTSYCQNIKYNQHNKVIGDFEYFETLFKLKPKFQKFHKLPAIQMGPGGNTSSGFKSFILVSKEFVKVYGFKKGMFKAFFRIPFKIISMVY